MTPTRQTCVHQNRTYPDLSLAHGLNIFGNIDAVRVIQCLGFHLEHSSRKIGCTEAERRMFAKPRKPELMGDVRPLLPAAEAVRLTDEAVKTAFTLVFTKLITRLPSAPWSQTSEMAERFDIKAP